MEAQSLHHSRRFPHHHFSPVIISPTGSAGYLIYIISAKVPDISRISFVLVRIIFSPHVSAAAPVFVAYTEVCQLPGFFSSIGLPEHRHGRFTIKGDIFDPLLHFMHCSAAEIPTYIGLGSDQFT